LLFRNGKTGISHHAHVGIVPNVLLLPHGSSHFLALIAAPEIDDLEKRFPTVENVIVISPQITSLFHPIIQVVGDFPNDVAFHNDR
jgi:hypothetical protein